MPDRDRPRLPGLLLVDPDLLGPEKRAREMEGVGEAVWSAADEVSADTIYHVHIYMIDVTLVDIRLPGTSHNAIALSRGETTSARPSR